MGKIDRNLDKFLRKHQGIGLDSCIFIYYFESIHLYGEKLRGLFTKIERGENWGVTSTISIIEILVKPKREGNFTLVDRLAKGLQSFSNLNIKDVDKNIAYTASDLRVKYNVKTPDAIQVAAALVSDATGFITNDLNLKKIKEIDVFVL